jgi:hypothetical protein
MRRWVVGQIGRLGSGEHIPGLSLIGDRWFKIKKAEDYFVKQKGEEGGEGKKSGQASSGRRTWSVPWSVP